MSVTFNELVSDVAGQVPGYSPLLARRDLNRAWRDICNRRTWSFLLKEGSFSAPPLIQAGTVTLTQNSTSVVADVTAATALNAVVAATPTLVQRQFRASTTGTIYSIVSWDNATRTLVLDRAVLESSSVGASYMVYQCYFPGPPESLQSDGTRDFNRWISVMDPVNGWTLKDDLGKAWIDTRDPQRTTTDLAFRWVDYKTDALGNMLFEFWPHPTAGQQYVCLYKSRGLEFTSGSSVIPMAVPDALIIDRCLSKYTYRWLSLNPGHDAARARTNWQSMKVFDNRQWEIDLQHAMLEDENVHMTAIVGPLRKRYGPPADASFLQAHSSGLEPWV